MKLYYTKGACSLAVRIVLNELDIRFDTEWVDLRTKKTASGEDFRIINAKGAVPVLRLDNGEFLTENAVILQYVADTAKASHLLPHVGDLQRYRVLEWVNYITTELHKSFGLLFSSLSQSVREEFVIPLIRSRFHYVNQHLAHHPFLLGVHFTLPDPYLFVILTWAEHKNIDLQEWPHIQAYYRALKERAAVQESLRQEREG